ncbi:MAG: hypothetical protein ABIP56_08125 [Dokdonella sp.]
MKLKAWLDSGHGFAYDWTASSNVAAGIQSEREPVKNGWASDAVERA